MYTWIWRHLPGGLPGKLAGSAVLLFGVVVFLFLVVFPWAEPRVPFNQVTVDTPSSSSSPSPSATPAAP